MYFDDKLDMEDAREDIRVTFRVWVTWKDGDDFTNMAEIIEIASVEGCLEVSFWTCPV